MRAASRFFLIALLSGCAVTPAPEGLDWAQHRDTVSGMEAWAFSGRIAVRTEDGGDTATLRWQQQQDDFSMTLSGPMGLKQATLLRENGDLSLVQDGKRRRLVPEDDPLRAEFGWQLPLDYMPWWLRGLPAPGPARQELAEGRLSRLEQAGWRIEYEAYQGVGNTTLPRVIRFERAEVNGKILLKSWTLAP